MSLQWFVEDFPFQLVLTAVIADRAVFKSFWPAKSNKVSIDSYIIVSLIWFDRSLADFSLSYFFECFCNLLYLFTKIWLKLKKIKITEHDLWRSLRSNSLVFGHRCLRIFRFGVFKSLAKMFQEDLSSKSVKVWKRILGFSHRSFRWNRKRICWGACQSRDECGYGGKK